MWVFWVPEYTASWEHIANGPAMSHVLVPFFFLRVSFLSWLPFPIHKHCHICSLISPFPKSSLLQMIIAVEWTNVYAFEGDTHLPRTSLPQHESLPMTHLSTGVGVQSAMLWHNELSSHPLSTNIGSSAWHKIFLKLISGCVEKLFFSFLLWLKFEWRKGLQVWSALCLCLKTSETTGISLMTSQDNTCPILNG